MAIGSGYMALAGVSGLMRGIAQGMQRKRQNSRAQAKEKTGNPFIEKIVSKWAESDDPQKMRAAVNYMKEQGYDPSLSLMRPETAQVMKESGQASGYIEQFPELTQPEPEYNLFENLQKFKEQQLEAKKLQAGEELAKAKVSTEKAKAGSQRALASQRDAKTKQLLERPEDRKLDLSALKLQSDEINEQLKLYPYTDAEGNVFDMPDRNNRFVQALLRKKEKIEIKVGKMTGIKTLTPMPIEQRQNQAELSYNRLIKAGIDVESAQQMTKKKYKVDVNTINQGKVDWNTFGGTKVK